MIPERERGYSVERDTGIVHERYQDHAPRAMRTSALGVTNVLDGREAVPCEVCFPQPKARPVKGKSEPVYGEETFRHSDDDMELAIQSDERVPSHELKTTGS